MKSVCVLGNGQLGRMLRQAGEPLGISVYPVGLDADPAELPIKQSIITAEIERWPQTALTRELAKHDAFINRDIFPRLADRLPQKQLLDQLGLATAPWQPLESADQWPAIFADFGELAIVKRRTGGYDGRGQWRLTAQTIAELPNDCYSECIVEKAIAFKSELSLVGARNAAGDIVFYPVTHNLHQQGILYASVAHPQKDNEHQQQAQTMLTAILNKLEYVGVMAMECFVTDDGLLINELAPRVHNSGHWTQNGASISQFALHLRAICGLPMPSPVVESTSVMINLIGCKLDYRWLSEALVHLHWYDKEVRVGRKVGHINLCSADPARLDETLTRLTARLPAEYAAAVEWAKSQY
ncbi:5-(carboxyamino)imidazole ribonucleotide synthase [Rosenbergiella australiborealis]|uniref:5-(carboxyamino)imidazole ribonucleotide synthase n=1 Tax=Rosenbergiella australiborealis TaxID=1544696 RepID=UPI001F4D6F2C|nr:5-(carboxyamino)imidazole ribonucleotide synthase [Rosenbergiella australiborealis]